MVVVLVMAEEEAVELRSMIGSYIEAVGGFLMEERRGIGDGGGDVLECRVLGW